MPTTILIIDDEPDIVKLLDYNLTKDNYLTLSAKNGEEGLSLAGRYAPDLVILDIMLPGRDGWDVCKVLRADPKTSSIPIIMLTAKAEDADKVLGLEIGADDYLTKPFSVRELIARVRTVIRRSKAADRPREVVSLGNVKIDGGRRKVFVGNKEIELTATEFNILKSLAEKGGRVMTRDDLISSARGEDVSIIDRAIDVHVAALRKKLGKHADLVETVRGVGYRIKEF